MLQCAGRYALPMVEIGRALACAGMHIAKGTHCLLVWAGAIAICCSTIAATAAIAQPSNVTPEDQLQAEMNLYKVDANNQRQLAEQLKLENDNLRKRVEGIDATLYAKFIEAKKKEYDFQVTMMDLNSDTIQHQHVASYVILGLVVCVVLSGLWFAYLQLMAGLAPLAAQGSVGGSDVGVQRSVGETKLDLSADKIAVTSSVVGIIVLLISLAFLYIYTREVYRIETIDPYKPKIAQPAEQSPKAVPAQ